MGGSSSSELVVEVDSSSWLLAAGDVVHAALEGTDEVASYSRTDDGLTPLARVAAGGVSPCHLAVSEGALLAACYEDGAVAVLDLDERGAVAGLRQVIAGEGSGPMPKQDGPHAHTVHPLADGRVLSLDLGADRLHVHRWTDGRLERIDSVALPAGTGPRDLIELPGGELGVLGEWSCELLLLEPLGDAFEIVQILALPGGTAGSTRPPGSRSRPTDATSTPASAVRTGSRSSSSRPTARSRSARCRAAATGPGTSSSTATFCTSPTSSRARSRPSESAPTAPSPRSETRSPCPRRPTSLPLSAQLVE